MNPSDLERSAFTALRKKFDPKPITAYERAARHSFQSIRAFSPADEREVRSWVSKADVVAVGGDALVPQDQKLSLELLSWSRMKGPHGVFLSDRAFASGRGTKRLMDQVRRLRLSVYGISPAYSLERRDRRLVAELRRRRMRGERIFLWTGALRLAPDRLPKLMKRAGLDAVCVVLQNPWARWRLKTDRGWTRTGNAFYRLETSPILTVQYHRAWHERTENLIPPAGLEVAFHKSLRLVFRKLNRRGKLPAWKIVHPFDLGFFRQAARGAWKPAIVRFLLERCRKGESAVLPEQKLVFLSGLLPGELTEEAAHLIRSLEQSQALGNFSSVVVEEAFGFLAGRWADPHRMPPAGLDPGGPWEAVHRAGYALGLALDRRWRRNAGARSEIRRLWNVKARTQGEVRKLLRALENLV